MSNHLSSSQSSQPVFLLLGLITLICFLCLLLPYTRHATEDDTTTMQQPLAYSELATRVNKIKQRRNGSAIFSGVYQPNLRYGLEIYAGAWLAPRERFLGCEYRIHKIAFLEGASFSVIGCDATFMTRDYFDFQVIHLSSATNQLPRNTRKSFYASLIARMEGTVKSFKMQSDGSALRNLKSKTSAKQGEDGKDGKDGKDNNPDNLNEVVLDENIIPEYLPHLAELDERLTKETVAMIPYSSTPASSDVVDDKFQNHIRALYFQATFWSIYRYIPNIVITAALPRDLKQLKSFNLPIWKIIDMSSIFNESAIPRTARGTHMLPKYSLLFVHDRLIENKPPWNAFNYVYFSEGDHVLHMRSATDIYNVMDATKDAPIALSPHRLQTIPLPKAFPEVESAWSKKDIARLSRIVLITENDTLSRGSCCDDGRFIFNNCKNWWYNCQEWGLTNYTKWVRFGESGYPMPFGSEHQAKCSYSPTKVLCPIPKNCKSRFPYRKEDATTFWYEACDEIPKREKTYNHTLALEKEREREKELEREKEKEKEEKGKGKPNKKQKQKDSTAIVEKSREREGTNNANQTPASDTSSKTRVATHKPDTPSDSQSPKLSKKKKKVMNIAIEDDEVAKKIEATVANIKAKAKVNAKKDQERSTSVVAISDTPSVDTDTPPPPHSDKSSLDGADAAKSDKAGIRSKHAVSDNTGSSDSSGKRTKKKNASKSVNRKKGKGKGSEASSLEGDGNGGGNDVKEGEDGVEEAETEAEEAEAEGTVVEEGEGGRGSGSGKGERGGAADDDGKRGKRSSLKRERRGKARRKSKSKGKSKRRSSGPQ